MPEPKSIKTIWTRELAERYKKRFGKYPPAYVSAEDSLKSYQTQRKLDTEKAEKIRIESGAKTLTDKQKRILNIPPPKPPKPIVPKKPTGTELAKGSFERVTSPEGGSPHDTATVAQRYSKYWEKRTEKPKSAEAKATDNYNEIHKRWKVAYGQWEDAKGDDKKRLRERLEDYGRDLLTLEGEIVKIRKANREKLKKLDISKYEVK